MKVRRCLGDLRLDGRNNVFLYIFIAIFYILYLFLYIDTRYFIIRLFDSPDYGTCLYIVDSTDPLTYTVVTLNIFFFVYILPKDGHRSGPKHVVVVHNKIEHEKYFVAYGGSN
jgi:hypothetical protein